jgi:hypothetical protein
MEKGINRLSHDAKCKKISCFTVISVIISLTLRTCDLNFFTVKQSLISYILWNTQNKILHNC